MFYNTNTTTAINSIDYNPLGNRYELTGWDCWNKSIKKTSEPTFDYIKRKEDEK